MNHYLLSLFAGINVAVALGSLVITTKTKVKHYAYFAIFSLFSASYFLSIVNGEYLNKDFHLVAILSAGIYYSSFGWFIYEFAELKNRLHPILITSVLLLACILFVVEPESEYFQISAHIALVYLLAIAIRAAILLCKKNDEAGKSFLFLTLLFGILCIEEIIHIHFGYQFFSQYFDQFLPLDVFPIFFSLIIFKQLSIDVFSKTRLELENSKLQIQEEKNKLKESERKRLKYELENKKKDLTDFGLEISRSKEFVSQLKQKIELVRKSPSQKDMEEIIGHMVSYNSNNSALSLFQENVDEVNHEFKEKLKSQFPKLSNNEIQICQFLRLNLSSKEIASIKNISTDSMKVLRHRLRKKLALESKTDISVFLHSI